MEVNGAVVLPVLNEVRCIDECIKSIDKARSDKYLNGEFSLVFVDNGSDDGSLERLNFWRNELHDFHVLKCEELGPGSARRIGCRFAIDHFANSGSQRFWLITTDADSIVPKDWLAVWTRNISRTESSLLVGNSDFLEDLSSIPIAEVLLHSRMNFIQDLEAKVGVVNSDGFNLAIESDCYQAIGGFTQPRSRTGGVLAGEDWALGCRARMNGFGVERVSSPKVAVSARRLFSDVLGYLTGESYDGHFGRVELKSDVRDISGEQLFQVINRVFERAIGHFFIKPLLIDPSLSSLTTMPGLPNQSWIQLRRRVQAVRYTNRYEEILRNMEMLQAEYGSELVDFFAKRCAQPS